MMRLSDTIEPLGCWGCTPPTPPSGNFLGADSLCTHFLHQRVTGPFASSQRFTNVGGNVLILSSPFLSHPRNFLPGCVIPFRLIRDPDMRLVAFIMHPRESMSTYNFFLLQHVYIGFSLSRLKSICRIVISSSIKWKLQLQTIKKMEKERKSVSVNVLTYKKYLPKLNKKFFFFFFLFKVYEKMFTKS